MRNDRTYYFLEVEPNPFLWYLSTERTQQWSDKGKMCAGPKQSSNFKWLDTRPPEVPAPNLWCKWAQTWAFKTTCQYLLTYAYKVHIKRNEYCFYGALLLSENKCVKQNLTCRAHFQLYSMVLYCMPSNVSYFCYISLDVILMTKT